ncbi:MAG: hypothetical protein HFJ12_00675 [Bacilli bacterium]|nr:hypothetical protein [Bacilli bacterium]
MGDVLDTFQRNLNNGNIRKSTLIKFLNEYDAAHLFINSNYDLIIQKISSGSYISVVETLYKDERLKRLLEDKFLDTIKTLKDTFYLNALLDVYLEGKDDSQKQNFLKPYFSSLVDFLKVSDLRILLEYTSLDKSFYNQVNDKIESNKREFFKGILSEKEVCGIKIYNDKQKELDTISDIAVLLMDELLEENNKNNQNLGYADIRYEKGGYSSVFIIGDKVLQIGDREEYFLPNHRRILQPLIRTDISTLVSEEIRIPSTIDVSQRVDKKSAISEEELYTVYKELRDDNILWIDIKKENVGRLLKPNKKHFSKNLADDKKVKGFMREIDSDCLGVGEIVVIDKDYIYDLNIRNKEEIDISWNCLAVLFEERYEKEKNINKETRVISSNKGK